MKKVLNKGESKINGIIERSNTIKMFSKEAWKALHETMGTLGVDQHSNPRLLAKGFTEFLDIWLEDNEICVCNIESPIVAGGKFYYHVSWREYDDVQIQLDYNLHDHLINRFSEYLLGD